MTTRLEAALVKARERLLSGAMNEAQVSQGPVRFTSGKQCYVAIIRHLVAGYPEFCDRFQSAKTRGKRAWISKRKEDLFPGRPDFQASEVTAVGGGWLVGTQMSAQIEMPKRVEAACACVGLVFGRDVKATFL